MKLMKYLFLFILFSISHTTNRNILEDHYTIQKGINTSSYYDVVVISERKYYENITFERKKPVVRPLYILDDDIFEVVDIKIAPTYKEPFPRQAFHIETTTNKNK